LPLKQFLINTCRIDDDNEEGVKQLKSFLGMTFQKTINIYFLIIYQFLGKRLDEKWELSNEHLIATLIHPNLKHFQISPYLRECATFLLK